MAVKVPTEISKFLGINESDSGETQLQLGESSDMQNFRVTNDYKLKKLEGYSSLFTTLGDYNVRGMWYGKLAGAYYLLFACNGHIYKHNLGTGVNTDLGTLTDATTTFFSFGNAVYILNGNEYKKWTGGASIATVDGYVPLIYVATPPAGGGTANEQINLLTGKKHQQFSGNNSSTAYQIAETSVDSIDSVYVGGVLKTVTTHYTVNTTTGVVTFTAGNTPPTGVNNVDIYWTKGTGSRTEITANKYYELFGGENDTRVFAFGDGTNRYYYTGLASGVPSAEYWPALNYNDVGSDEYAITDMKRHYDRLVVYKENESWYCQYTLIDDGSGNQIPFFPTYPLNAVIGNIPYGQARVINNNPVTIMEGVYEWQGTNVRDERNAVFISRRVRKTLDTSDLSSAITFDYEYQGELWIALGTTVVVYNYKNDTWYKFKLTDTPTCFVSISNVLYFGTSAGTIMRFGTSLRAFNNASIDSYWQMGFYDVNEEWMRKYLNKTWIALKPESQSKLDVYWTTNRAGKGDTPVTISYNNIDFTKLDLELFTFLTNYNPQPFRIKTKAKKWTYFKLILENNSQTFTAHVISINMLPQISGESK